MDTATLDGRPKVRVLFGSVRPGDFVTFGGHGLNAHLTEQWWRVEGVARDTFDVVNRAGRRSTVRVATWQGIKIYKWFTVAEIEARARL